MVQKEQMEVGQQYACMLYTWRSCSMPIGQVVSAALVCMADKAELSSQFMSKFNDLVCKSLCGLAVLSVECS